MVVDRSHWGRLRLAGDDRLAFLHGQSTADIEALVGGAGCETASTGQGGGRRAAPRGARSRCFFQRCRSLAVPPALPLTPSAGLVHLIPTCVRVQVFVTAQARCLDLASVYAQGSGLMVVLSPGTKDALLERLNKYIFPNDKVGEGAV